VRVEKIDITRFMLFGYVFVPRGESEMGLLGGLGRFVACSDGLDRPAVWSEATGSVRHIVIDADLMRKFRKSELWDVVAPPRF
jgi:hypothetical protein